MASRSARTAVRTIEERFTSITQLDVAQDAPMGCAPEDISSASEPKYNVDGAPMLGPVDIHGNPYGVTASSHSSWEESSMSINVDGSPMLGDFDIHGHPYGVFDVDDHSIAIHSDNSDASASSLLFDDSNANWESNSDMHSSSETFGGIDDWSTTSLFDDSSSSFSSFDD